MNEVLEKVLKFERDHGGTFCDQTPEEQTEQDNNIQALDRACEKLEIVMDFLYYCSKFEAEDAVPLSKLMALYEELRN